MTMNQLLRVMALVMQKSLSYRRLENGHAMAFGGEQTIASVTAKGSVGEKQFIDWFVRVFSELVWKGA